MTLNSVILHSAPKKFKRHYFLSLTADGMLTPLIFIKPEKKCLHSIAKDSGLTEPSEDLRISLRDKSWLVTLKGW